MSQTSHPDDEQPDDEQPDDEQPDDEQPEGQNEPEVVGVPDTVPPAVRPSFTGVVDADADTHDEIDALIESGGQVVGRDAEGEPLVEGPDSA